MDSRARLRSIMRRKGLTHAQVAKRIRAHRVSVTEWLTARKNPSLAKRKLLLQVYGLDPFGWRATKRAA